MTMSDITNFLHLLATTTWIGGMIYINLVLNPSLAAIDPPQRGKLVGAAAKRFVFYANGSVLILLITGLMMTPSGLLFNFSTTYGLVLTLKHFLVLSMILIGLVITIFISPKLGSLAPESGGRPSPNFLRTQALLSRLAFINMVLGILVLLCVAILQ
jgi:putative copper export protein